MNIRSVIIFIAVAGLVLLGFWMSRFIVVEPVAKRETPTYSIRTNPFAALEHLLKERGQNVESMADRTLLHELPAATDVLVVRNLKLPLTLDREDALLEWVEQGGTLIMEPYWLGTSAERPYFAQRLGVIIQELENWHEYDTPGHAMGKVNDEEVILHITPRHVLSTEREDASVVLLSEDVGIQGLHLFQGQGEIIFLSDTRFLDTPEVWFFENAESSSPYQLGAHDHAYFFLHLVEGRGKVWLLYDTKAKGFLWILYERFPQTMVSVCLLLVLFMAYLFKRYGPVRSQPETVQRDLQQHLLQVGKFHWQQDKCQTLLSQWRLQVLNNLELKHPVLSGLNPQSQLPVLIQITGLGQDELEQAFNRPCKTERDLIQSIQSLQKIWKA